jgi:Cu(I)/Ag(I) efflux system membrane fusion protein
MTAPEQVERRWVQRLISSIVVLIAIAAAFGLGRGAAPPTDASDGSGASSAAPSAGENVTYVCPMHPQIRQPTPGSCPICFMDLVPVVAGAGDSSGISVSLSDSEHALARVQTSVVERVALTREVRLFGRVAGAESADANITAWAGGRIERLHTATVGQTVRRGDRVASIYSPDIVVAQETLIHAMQSLEEARAAGSELRTQSADLAIRQARTELRQLGLADDSVDEIIADGNPDETVIIRAPHGGTVTDRMVREGDWVEPGMPIVSVTSLNQVWVQLEVYERDLPFVRPGDPVDIMIAGTGLVAGRIAFLDPYVDPMLRIVRARVELPNPSGQLRPGQFVEAVLQTELLDDDGRPPISVPSSAVLWTGPRSIVYVVDSLSIPPAYVPVEVEIGPRAGSRTVVRAGVFPGEEVVSHGAFRIDSTLQIRGGRSMMSGPAGDAAIGGGEPHAH